MNFERFSIQSSMINGATIQSNFQFRSFLDGYRELTAVNVDALLIVRRSRSHRVSHFLRKRFSIVSTHDYIPVANFAQRLSHITGGVNFT